MHKNSAFTLVELLVVMAIIGILAALIFPALGSIRNRAFTTQSHELVSQVQAAWLIHFNDFRSYPDTDLFEKGQLDSGDITVPMSPYNLCVLNWRCPRPLDYDGNNSKWQTEVKKIIKTAIDAKTDNKPHALDVDGKDKKGRSKKFAVETRDAYFEIDQIQWICGLLNVWGNRKAQALYKSGGRSSAENVVQALAEDKFADPRVFVKLDTGYDGKVNAPITTTTTTAEVLNKSAVAWVNGPTTKNDPIVSW